MFISNNYMNIYLNNNMNIHMNIHTTLDQVTRAMRLAWTRKFDENLKQGWSDEDEDSRFESLCMFCVETVSMSARPDLTGWIGPGDDGCGAAFPRAVPRWSAPGDARCTFSKHPLFFYT